MTRLKLLSLIVCILPTLVQAQKTSYSCSQKGKYLNAIAGQKAASAGAADRYDVNFYKLDLQLERNSIYVEGNVTVKAVTTTSMDTFCLDLHDDFTVDSVYFNGQKNTFNHSSDLLSIVLQSTLNSGSKTEAVVYYHGNAPQSGSSAIGQGLSTGSSPSWGNEVTWSLSQPYSAYEWFPVKMELIDKADSVEVWITTDTANLAGSNGLLQGITPMGNGKHRFEWKSNYSIAYYLISIAVAEYVDYTYYYKPSNSQDSFPIVNYIYNNPGTLPNFKDEIDKTGDMMRVFSDKFGPYPFRNEKYGHCMAPFSGGMEHQTMTSQGFFVTDLTSHELAHQWFGDDVTCGSWSDLFLNEGFASYLEYVFVQEEEPNRALNWLVSTYNSALQPSGSVFVDDTANVSRLFSSSLTYNKGAFVLHMLRYEIDNDSIFFNGLKSYYDKFKGGTARLIDFKTEMEQYANMDFTVFFDQWYYGQGYPEIDIKWAQVNEKLYLQLDQFATSPFVTEKFESHIDLKITRSNASTIDTTLRLFFDDHSNRYEIENLRGNFITAELDPDIWILHSFRSLSEDPALGLENNSRESSLNIYPNPFGEEFTIKYDGNKKISSIDLLDVNARLIKEVHSIQAGRTSISMEGELPGNYILSVKYEDGSVENRKLIKE